MSVSGMSVNQLFSNALPGAGYREDHRPALPEAQLFSVMAV
jgi:hypothetical protein